MAVSSNRKLIIAVSLVALSAYFVRQRVDSAKSESAPLTEFFPREVHRSLAPTPTRSSDELFAPNPTPVKTDAPTEAEEDAIYFLREWEDYKRSLYASVKITPDEHVAMRKYSVEASAAEAHLRRRFTGLQSRKDRENLDAELDLLDRRLRKDVETLLGHARYEGLNNGRNDFNRRIQHKLRYPATIVRDW